ncbi:UDP-N-acetylmuramoylalanyl-D-glutamate--2,6-diaminopimelate ligase [Nitrosococcus oceani ATCC 19707]|uniref:UDP-N-acetylmuramoyl-L-alanyl-D-glutamate--2,6-diaminopimelate ligase n=2 Tax=Nitrosococcus oceani TaxID=1229 RepID=Q3J784_NITOC|nr:UDP-N-acetylmuramoyl-L-alanyl-D-glutamate--2,6-diaminopimelate ligase [Nitrosococcus oceani]ABA59312.1 UDP-N-acetylmuramoylalanyl-D-glutamate--2,6-diaminopimelate ligase [Nitrosococcus oceani ATCC 19707]EDZ65467.1 UDP-N-acetylmuramyl-tripeptide synthetases subfamily [Nitrosococcus oceani AFC27]KFI18340.1 UDP-N-acetylmuramyl peptide synthase [Nitrosococcus oceani C-27]GEM21138.1 UDP-N-acetylmuramoyl-L-alanyl-D-glutamate--2,6-diaminopimelate ligase [Nitrosococcus oceani]
METAARERGAMVAASRDRSCCLSDLLAEWVSIGAVQERRISSLSLDSRRVAPGALFFACQGTQRSGHGHIGAAVDQGAAAIVYDPVIPVSPAIQTRLQVQNIPLIPLPDLGARVGIIADRFYLRPSRQVCVLGVTGTNGKTSVSHFLAQALHRQGIPCGLVGTLGKGLVGTLQPSPLTTPDAVTVQEQLAAMAAARIRYTVLEVSSHALEQGRVNGVVFNTAIFTNLSREHLDYHGDMVRYEAAKFRLFNQPELRHAVINIDDVAGRAFLANLPSEVAAISYGITNPQANLWASELHCDRYGIAMTVQSAWGEGQLTCSLLGRFNAYNLLAALGGLLVVGMPFTEALQRLSQVRAVAGRMEAFGEKEGEPLLVVDYAHTPDALEQVLCSLQMHLGPGGRLWCVFGCGGDRDRGKRPLMGAAAERLADFVILTDDNPRDEDPIQIIIDILSGIHNPDRVYQFRSRSEAIIRATQLAGPEDIVLIAGKGHEEYQQIGAEQRPFSDREQVQEALRQRRGGLR